MATPLGRQMTAAKRLSSFLKERSNLNLVLGGKIARPSASSHADFASNDSAEHKPITNILNELG